MCLGFLSSPLVVFCFSCLLTVSHSLKFMKFLWELIGGSVIDQAERHASESAAKWARVYSLPCFMWMREGSRKQNQYQAAKGFSTFVNRPLCTQSTDRNGKTNHFLFSPASCCVFGSAFVMAEGTIKRDTLALINKPPHGNARLSLAVQEFEPCKQIGSFHHRRGSFDGVVCIQSWSWTQNDSEIASWMAKRRWRDCGRQGHDCAFDHSIRPKKSAFVFFFWERHWTLMSSNEM